MNALLQGWYFNMNVSSGLAERLPEDDFAEHIHFLLLLLSWICCGYCIELLGQRGTTRWHSVLRSSMVSRCDGQAYECFFHCESIDLAILI